MSMTKQNSRWANFGYAIGIALLIWLTGMTRAYAQAEIGEVLFARGVATASQEGSIRLMGEGTPLYEKDVLTTSNRSVAVIKLQDGSRMTIRPNSVFEIAEYSQKSGSESLLLNMLKGGLRAISGLISKRNPDAFVLHTSVATIGIRGTDFSARICTDDCAIEADKLAEKESSSAGDTAVARLAFAKGELIATSSDGKERVVHLGGAIYEGDTLQTGADAFAVLAFRDESRITLQANTRFQIAQHAYTEAKPEETGALMQLFKGGIRAVSGLISKVRPESYKVKTPVGTLSTRGTKFTAFCPTPDCFVVTHEGLLRHEIEGTSTDLPPKSVAFFRQNTKIPSYDIPIPDNMLQELNRAPKPEEINIDPNLFGTAKRAPESGSLNVTVYDKGQADVTLNDGTRLSVGEGESVQASSGEVVRLDEIPKHVSEDRYNISPSSDDTQQLNKLDFVDENC